MKNVLFVATHLFSGAEDLSILLNSSPKVQITHTGTVYNHPTSLEPLFAAGHKLRTNGAIYGDLLLYNTSLCSEIFYDFCKFIYVIRSAAPTLNLMVEKTDYSQQGALRYYTYRLERLCEMAKRTPKGLIVTWDSLNSGKAFPAIEEHLDLINPIKPFGFTDESKDLVHYETIQEAQDSYERHLYYMKHLPITLIE